MPRGIRDKVAILGMGCSNFGERWDMNADDLMVEAYTEALKDAGIETKQIDAAWLATAIEEQHVGKSAVPLALALRLPFIPVTRVENYCASGTEAFRGAVYAVASGAADIALALGVEKLKDTGYGGLPQRGRGTLNNMTWPNLSAPGSFAQLAAAYRAKFGSSPEDMKRAMAHISVKSHDNGAKNPKAHLRNKITIDTVLNVLTTEYDTTTTVTVLREGIDRVNRVSYVEVPLFLDLHTSAGRLTFGARGGPFVGFRTEQRTVLPGAEGANGNLADATFRSTVFGWSARVYARYRLTDRWSLGMEPGMRGSFGDVMDTPGIARRNSAWGAWLSLSYRLP